MSFPIPLLLGQYCDANISRVKTRCSVVNLGHLVILRIIN